MPRPRALSTTLENPLDVLHPHRQINLDGTVVFLLIFVSVKGVQVLSKPFFYEDAFSPWTKNDDGISFFFYFSISLRFSMRHGHLLMLRKNVLVKTCLFLSSVVIRTRRGLGESTFGFVVGRSCIIGPTSIFKNKRPAYSASCLQLDRSSRVHVWPKTKL